MEFLKRYILPGITFQSIVIGGAYCTGQEVLQHFLSLGPVNGFCALLVTTLIWSITCALCFVLATLYEAYDYKTFFKVLLGRGWVLFEISYLYSMIIALSIIAAAIGSMLEDLLNIPYIVGILIAFVYIIVMAFKEGAFIRKLFSFWSFLLYAVFIAFLICSYEHTHLKNVSSILSLPQGIEWIKSGIAFASYNLGCIPALLFTLRGVSTNKQALVSGLLAGPLAAIPAILLYMAMLSEYPQVLSKTIPATYMLGEMHEPILTVAFSIILFGALVESGVGLVHAFYENVTRSDLSQKLSGYVKHWNIILVFILLIAAFVLSQFGMINLIVKGYGILHWCMISILILPLLTNGLFKIGIAWPKKLLS